MAKQVEGNRLPTGVDGLDIILRGGLLRGGLYILIGPPGAGKTVLGNQICFHHIASGGKAVYITLLAETHSKMLSHIENMAFFDLDPIADTLQYISGYRILDEEGLEGFLGFLRRTITQQEPSLLVIDGTATIDGLSQSELVLKGFYHELQAYTEMSKCTILLLTHSPVNQFGRPEHTMVDGLIELRDRAIGLRAVREIEVRKLRGSGFLRGTHFFNISDMGITVYPRTEALLAAGSFGDEDSVELLSFGNPSLDRLVGGGLHSSSTTLVFGTPGSGKTVLGLQFLAAGAQQGEKGLLLGFYERPRRLVRKAQAIGLDFERYVASEDITILWLSAMEDVLDVMAYRLLEVIRQRNIRRVFLDGLDALRWNAIYPERLPRLLTVLTNELRGLNVTIIASSESQAVLSRSDQAPTDYLSAIFDNHIYIRRLELRAHSYHLMSVLKMRDNVYETSTYEFKINEQGIVVAPTSESAERLLSGLSPDNLATPGSDPGGVSQETQGED